MVGLFPQLPMSQRRRLDKAYGAGNKGHHRVYISCLTAQVLLVNQTVQGEL